MNKNDISVAYYPHRVKLGIIITFPSTYTGSCQRSIGLHLLPAHMMAIWKPPVLGSLSRLNGCPYDCHWNSPLVGDARMVYSEIPEGCNWTMSASIDWYTPSFGIHWSRLWHYLSGSFRPRMSNGWTLYRRLNFGKLCIVGHSMEVIQLQHVRCL